MTEPNVIGGLLGGALIGAAAVAMLAFNGRIAGISGILGGLTTTLSTSDRLWRIAFLAGLIAGPLLYHAGGARVPLDMRADGVLLAVAGLLVGIGTRIGGGCTSGHGVCGLARRSPRSLAATAIFMSVAVATVFATRHMLGQVPV